MSEVAFFAVLLVLLIVIVVFVLILERQARKTNELVGFLVGQFRDISRTQDDTHQRQLDSMIAANMSQADRHQKAVDSLLGLIDEMSSRSNPEKITAQQYKQYEQYLLSEASKPR